jgi:hypothetical protein
VSIVWRTELCGGITALCGAAHDAKLAAVTAANIRAKRFNVDPLLYK